MLTEAIALSDPSFNAKRTSRDTTFTAAFTLIAAGIACGIVLVVMPRPIEPKQLPPLALAENAVAQQLATDARAAAAVPTGARVSELYELYLEEGLAESMGAASSAGTGARRKDIQFLSSRLFDELGPDGVRALRAHAVARFLTALAGKLSDEHEVTGLVGGVRPMFERYGLIDAEGRLLAPELTVRTAYKVRWNLAYVRPAYDQLTEIEQQAYAGFFALHSAALAPAQRAEMARDFERAHGQHSREAFAIWLYQGDLLERSEAMLLSSYELRSELRVRNMELFVRYERTLP
jgi:hypothetical protein